MIALPLPGLSIFTSVSSALMTMLASTRWWINRSRGRKARAVRPKSPHSSDRDSHRFNGPRSNSCCRYTGKWCRNFQVTSQARMLGPKGLFSTACGGLCVVTICEPSWQWEQP